jgi:hypothetical protein
LLLDGNEFLDEKLKPSAFMVSVEQSIRSSCDASLLFFSSFSAKAFAESRALFQYIGTFAGAISSSDCPGDLGKRQGDE